MWSIYYDLNFNTRDLQGVLFYDEVTKLRANLVYKCPNEHEQSQLLSTWTSLSHNQAAIRLNRRDDTFLCTKNTIYQSYTNNNTSRGVRFPSITWKYSTNFDHCLMQYLSSHFGFKGRTNILSCLLESNMKKSILPILIITELTKFIQHKLIHID